METLLVIYLTRKAKSTNYLKKTGNEKMKRNSFSLFTLQDTLHDIKTIAWKHIKLQLKQQKQLNM